MIDRVKLTSAAKQQLINLKRRTGIEHYNTICRHALVVSLNNPANAPIENLQFANGIEIDWEVFCGGHGNTYLNLLITRAAEEGVKPTESNIRQLLSSHLHRGLSYLSSRNENEISTIAAIE